jgi:hypothetical protein
MHYSPNKNFSVFRKFLGGALMRKCGPNNPCLRPHPGKGHWEKQDAPKCSKCESVEKDVDRLLKRKFSFRCVNIQNKHERDRFEKKIIGIISKCGICKPSSRWLGLKSYSDKVKSSGLWNSNHVFGPDQMTPLDLVKLKRYVDQTIKLYRKQLS